MFNIPSATRIVCGLSHYRRVACSPIHHRHGMKFFNLLTLVYDLVCDVRGQDLWSGLTLTYCTVYCTCVVVNLSTTVSNQITK